MDRTSVNGGILVNSMSLCGAGVGPRNTCGWGGVVQNLASTGKLSRVPHHHYLEMKKGTCHGRGESDAHRRTRRSCGQQDKVANSGEEKSGKSGQKISVTWKKKSHWPESNGRSQSGGGMDIAFHVRDTAGKKVMN